MSKVGHIAVDGDGDLVVSEAVSTLRARGAARAENSVAGSAVFVSKEVALSLQLGTSEPSMPNSTSIVCIDVEPSVEAVLDDGRRLAATRRLCDSRSP